MGTITYKHHCIGLLMNACLCQSTRMLSVPLHSLAAQNAMVEFQLQKTN